MREPPQGPLERRKTEPYQSREMVWSQSRPELLRPNWLAGDGAVWCGARCGVAWCGQSAGHKRIELSRDWA
eukprot:5233266-Prorocentrum_lima.AAC.1